MARMRVVIAAKDKKFFREFQKRVHKRGKYIEWGCNLIEKNGRILVDKNSCVIGNRKGMLFNPPTRQAIADIHSHPVTPVPTAYDLIHALAEDKHFQCVWHVPSDQINCVGNLKEKTKGVD